MTIISSDVSGVMELGLGLGFGVGKGVSRGLPRRRLRGMPRERRWLRVCWVSVGGFIAED